MSLHGYLEKQRAKPVRERERLAIIWTAIGFSVILVVWIVSFREMNKAEDPLPVDSPASLGDLKTDFLEGKNSIQDMMEQVPASPMGEAEQTAPSNIDLNTGIENQVPAEDNTRKESENFESVPQLP